MNRLKVGLHVVAVKAIGLRHNKKQQKDMAITIDGVVLEEEWLNLIIQDVHAPDLEKVGEVIGINKENAMVFQGNWNRKSSSSNHWAGIHDN